MVRKKVEGNEEERRAAARAAREAGEPPSKRGATTGASKQRTHTGQRGSPTHEEKLRAQHRGKQEWRAGDLAEENVPDPAARDMNRSFQGRGKPAYGDDHERVFQALASAEQKHGGEPVSVAEIARTAHMGEEDTRVLLHDLVSVHRLATELQEEGDPTEGQRYETKPGH
ncbi:hypothetical protein [Streptomyces sp. NPDC003077]|uniref:hypothetical protein n=1 Tax=Streptomyces sp. NPDC003077 TaxID=3154443 RepID=UPI0033B7ABEA